MTGADEIQGFSGGNVRGIPPIVRANVGLVDSSMGDVTGRDFKLGLNIQKKLIQTCIEEMGAR